MEINEYIDITDSSYDVKQAIEHENRTNTRTITISCEKHAFLSRYDDGYLQCEALLATDYGIYVNVVGNFANRLYDDLKYKITCITNVYKVFLENHLTASRDMFVKYLYNIINNKVDKQTIEIGTDRNVSNKLTITIVGHYLTFKLFDDHEFNLNDADFTIIDNVEILVDRLSNEVTNLIEQLKKNAKLITSNRQMLIDHFTTVMGENVH